jgi:hypothetical protein
MKKIFLVLSLTIGLFFVSNANAQTPITFEKGKMSKTLTITVKPKGENKYVITVKKGQVINVSTSGNVGLSKTNPWIVVNPSIDYKEGVDLTQDGEGYFSIYTGRSGKYIISVGSSAKESRTVKLLVEVSNNKEDFEGGEPVDQ